MATAIDIVIRAKDATVAAWNSVSKQAQQLGRRVGAALSSAADFAKKAAVAVGIFGAAVIAAGKKAVAAYQQQAAAEAKLAATLKATGYAAGFTTGELKKSAAELQKLTGVGDEVILSMQGMLASFDKIKGDNFTRATMAALDMSAVLRKAGASSAEVEGAALQLGKALQDPVGQLGMLSRVGISFTDQQKDQIKAMVEAGDAAAAQSLILAELETRFGGTAKAVADSQHGMLQLKAAFGDTMEVIGKAILDVDGLDGVIAKVTSALENLQKSGYIELWAEGVSKAFSAVRRELGYVVEWVKPAVEWLGGAVKNISGFLGGMSVTMGQHANDPLWKKLTGVSLFQAVSEAGAAAGEASVTGATDKTTEQRLAEIRAEKQAAQDAADAKEKADMQAAQASVVASTAEAKAEKAVAEKVDDTNDLRREKAELQEQLLRDAHRAEAQAMIEGADSTIEKASKRLDELAMSTSERRDAERQKRQQDFDDRRRVRLDEKAAKGGKLSRFEREYIEAAKLRSDVRGAEAEKLAAAENQKKLDELEAKERRRKMQESLESIEKKLATNLQAAGG